MYKIEIIEKLIERKNEIIKLLKQLSTIDNIKEEDILQFLSNKHPDHIIYICKEIEKDKIVGIITVFIERKLIHNLGKVAHIEDLVVDKEERNKGISQLLIDKCVNHAKIEKCYKIILNCNENLIKFYEKKKFYNAGYQMRMNI